MDMSWKLLDKITGRFSDKIGSGGFGEVYKGKEAGQEIAVKVLRDRCTDLDGNAFKREFENLTKLKHPNIVQLVGVCYEEEKTLIKYNEENIIATKLRRALCFEYLKNGSLQKHLSDDHREFDWQNRYMIIKGICMGLKYLHTELERPLYHLDLKPDNILLGDNMVPKIADFGLSRLIGEKTSQMTSIMTKNAVATLGYCPPEFVREAKISNKYDIYSLGIIIIKIICGPDAHYPGDDKTHKFIRQVHKKWRERLRATPGYTPLDVDCQCNLVKKCIEIALICANEDKERRPNIGYVFDQLAKIEKRNNDEANSINESHAVTWLPKHLEVTFLKEITLDFATERELGRSAFGTLYKGILSEGGTIAVARLDENAPVRKTFVTEAANLLALEHKNIVRLVGFCHEAKKKVIHNGRNVVVNVMESYLCYEYLPKESLDCHIYGNSSLDWDTRFKIIKGICQGLHFLHKELDRSLVHMNLQPKSIWLDDNWVPKLAYCGYSRLFEELPSWEDTLINWEPEGYMAPEYIYRGEFSTRSDIYCLGIIILEITTRLKNYTNPKDMASRDFVDHVRETCTDEQIMYMYPTLDKDGLQQVYTCILIGLKCTDVDQNKRPDIRVIVDTLNGTRVPISEKIWAATSSADEITPTSSALLHADPPELRFPFEPNKSISCPLRLINATDEYVAARLVTNNPKRYVAATLLCGVVPPRSSYTLAVTVKEHKPLVADEVLSLESCVVRNKSVNVKNADVHTVGFALKKIFEEARRSGTDNNVQAQRLKVGFDAPKKTTYDQPFQYEIEIISDKKLSQATCVDVHPVEPWIMTSHHGGDIFIWDYQEQEIESPFNFTQQRPVNSVRFIEREGWFVAGDSDGIIDVYSYETDEKVTSFEAHEGEITSLAVHPTDPLVISSSEDYMIKIWDWKKGWECIRTFEGHSDTVMQVIFNPVDTNSFASASSDQTIKIWNISSSKCKKTLSDDLVGLPCVLTYTGDTGQCLVTGSSDGTTQIWDLETENKCVQTLEGHTDRISCVYWHPELLILLTGSHDGTVRSWSWNSDTYRLKDIFGIKLGAVYAFGYIKSVKRVVVACHQGIAIMKMK